MFLEYHIMEGFGMSVVQNQQALNWLEVPGDEVIAQHLVSESGVVRVAL
jgi:hypothetical protein